MIKKALLLTIPFLLLASQENVANRITALENELKSLKAEVQDHQENFDEQTPILEEAEKKINFG